MIPYWLQRVFLAPEKSWFPLRMADSVTPLTLSFCVSVVPVVGPSQAYVNLLLSACSALARRCSTVTPTPQDVRAAHGGTGKSGATPCHQLTPRAEACHLHLWKCLTDAPLFSAQRNSGLACGDLIRSLWGLIQSLNNSSASLEFSWKISITYITNEFFQSFFPFEGCSDFRVIYK